MGPEANAPNAPQYMRNTLLLATDKLGSRPVYYVRTGRYLYFSSFLKTLTRLSGIPKRLNI